MKRIRVASLQYFIRPVTTFDQFRDQVAGLVDTAKDYKCDLMVFPEYFTLQLLTLSDVRRPIRDQVRGLSTQAPRFLEMMEGLTKGSKMHIVAGTIPMERDGKIQNVSHLFSPTGAHGEQGKLHMTRFESEEWGVSPDDNLKVFETSLGRLAIAVCYDVEFPEVSRAAARTGVHVLVVPSCTDDRQGYLRVRYCAHARAIENQLYVIQSSTVGSLPMVPAVSLNYGQAVIVTPSDFAFARDGILAEGIPNQETMVIGELNLETIAESRAKGTVLPLRDSEETSSVVSRLEIVSL